MSKQSIKKEHETIARLRTVIEEQAKRIKELELALESAGVPICQENDYPPIPQDAEYFQHHYGFRKPTAIHQWRWSIEFNRWKALVTFEDGWYGWTYPSSFSMLGVTA